MLDLIQLGLLVPSKQNYFKETVTPNDIDLSYSTAEEDMNLVNDENDVLMYSKLLIGQLPQFSKNRTECEASIKHFVKSYNLQKVL